MASPERKRWRLVFEVGSDTRVLAVGKGDTRAADDAVAAFKSLVRDAMESDGCRSFVVGVHVEGAACDHEVGP